MNTTATNKNSCLTTIEGFVASWTSDHDEALAQARIVFDDVFPAQAQTDLADASVNLAA